MNKFAIAFRAARLESGKKFREIADFTRLSIGYLSDIDNGRRNPPEIPVVKEIEKLFGITDGHLVKLAREERASLRTNLGSLIKSKPLLEELLLRGDELSDNDLKDIISQMRQKAAATGNDDDERLFFNDFNAKFSGFMNDGRSLMDQ
jgi:transcriptional regulator with XRE-family HTH domain